MTVDLVDVGANEAGAALLGAALLGGEAARGAVKQLAVHELNDTRQAAVLEAMLALITEDVPLDPVTVLGRLRAGGAEVAMPAGREAAVYLADLMERGGAIDPAFHLQVIREHAFRRTARTAGQRINQAAGSSSLTDLVATVRDEAIKAIAAAKRAGLKP